jgi:hypothetical protein
VSEEEKGSAKYEAFMVDLRTLCRQHGVTIQVSRYDSVQIWDWDEFDNDENCINQGDTVDRTKK